MSNDWSSPHAPSSDEPDTRHDISRENPFDSANAGEEIRSFDSTEAEESYYDRERWRAVGDDLERLPLREREGYLRLAGLSMFSMTIIALATLFAAMFGLLLLNFFPKGAYRTASPTLRKHFRTIPERWIGFHQDIVFSIDGGDTACFCVNEQQVIFIGGDRHVAVYTEKGLRVGLFPVTGTPLCMTIPKTDRLFAEKLLLGFRDRVEIYEIAADYTAKLITEWKPFAGNVEISSLAVSGDAVYVADSGEKVIYKCNAQGEILLSIGVSSLSKPSEKEMDKQESHEKTVEAEPIAHEGSGPVTNASRHVFTGFDPRPTVSLSLAVAPSGHLIYVTNPGVFRIETFRPDGTWVPELSWGDATTDFVGFCAPANPVGLSVMSDGRLLTVEKTINRIKLYGTDGFLSTVVAPSEQLDRLPGNLLERGRRDVPRNLLPYAAQRPLQAAPMGDRVVVFDPVFHLIRIYQP